MKIQYCSDLHLEFGPDLSLPGGEVLILAGDIVVHKHLNYNLIQWFQTECSKYDQVFYILGNHEHYSGTFNKTLDRLREFMPDNVNLMENQLVHYKGVDFLGCTLWTDMNKSDPLTLFQMPNLINDYRVIKNEYSGGYGKLSPDHTAQIHKQSVEFLTQNLAKVKGQAVVFTHHAPSLESINVRYRNAKDFYMNGGYASDLSNLILDNTDKIKYWIHGHMHDATEYTLGQTQIVCNPRGYISYEPSAASFKVKEFEIIV
jgi:Icc-related predicted phosphoesterase